MKCGTQGTKGQTIRVFLFDGGSYSLCDYVSNEVRFYVYGTTSLNVNNKDNAVCVRAFDDATVHAYGGTAIICAYDSAEVCAYKGSQVFANDSATVNALGCESVQAFNNVKVYSYGANVLNIYDNTNLINCDKNTMVNAYGSANIISVKSDNIKADENVNISFFDNIEEKHISNYNIYELEYNDIKILRNWYYKNETNKDYIICLCNNEIPRYHSMGEEYNKRRKRNITEFNYNTI